MNKLLLGKCITVFLLLSITTVVLIFILTYGVIQAPYSANAPNIDGQWTTPSEWSSASEYRRAEGNWTAYLRMENNGTHIFMLVDYVSDQSQSSLDSLTVFFDTKNDGGIPALDDYRFYYQSGNIYSAYGSGSEQVPYNWTGFSTPPSFQYAVGFSHINDPYDNQHDHETYEVAIPLSFLTTSKTMGFFVDVSDSRTSADRKWPTGSGSIISWGVLSLDTGPINTIFIALVLIIAVIAGLLLYRRHRKTANLNQ